MLIDKKDYCKTLTGKEWETCSIALILQMANDQNKIKEHLKAIESLKKQIKAYDTIHYKIKGYYLHIKPDCYKGVD